MLKLNKVIKMDVNRKLIEWLETVSVLHLPRWHDLPEIDLYIDQVVTLIERYCKPLISHSDEKVLTKSMVNNYVKWQLIDSPVKKQYTRKHIAYLIVITMLKQIITINEIRIAIDQYVSSLGEKEAYNSFVEIQEQVICSMAKNFIEKGSLSLSFERDEERLYPIRFAVISLGSKLITEKLIEHYSMTIGEK